MWPFNRNSKPANWVKEERLRFNNDDDEDDFDFLGLNDIEHLDGIPWHEAPLPPLIHRCKEQSRGWIGFNYYGRCACGAIRGNHDVWRDKNQTRKYNRREKLETTRV